MEGWGETGTEIQPLWTNNLWQHVVAWFENECGPALRVGLCGDQADCCGGVQSKNYYVPLWVDAAEPASRSPLWLGRSPACTHLSPTQETKTQPIITCTFIFQVSCCSNAVSSKAMVNHA